jgi:3'-phosphoadenosine 5'-phosphosulfate sulfotransferase (PAPS reductase)/FAD synthetase
MPSAERSKFLLYSELDEHKDRIDEAKQIIKDAFDDYGKPYVAFSGGKDSTIMLHMALECDPGVVVYHWDFGQYFMPRDLEAETIEIAHKLGVANLITDTSKWYDIKKRRATNVFFRIHFGPKQDQFVSDGIDLALVGLRSQESKKRKWKTSDGAFKWNGKMTECYPIYKLTSRDVWAYIVSHDLPYCSHYDRYGALIGYEEVRLSTFFDPEFKDANWGIFDSVLMPGFKHYNK